MHVHTHAGNRAHRTATRGRLGRLRKGRIPRDMRAARTGVRGNGMWDFLAAQWLGLHTSTFRAWVQSLGQGALRSHNLGCMAKKYPTENR